MAEADKPIKVMVVDDDKDLAAFIKKILSDAGYEIEVASNGFLAGAMLNSFMPDVMTLDLNMPGVNGHQILEFVGKTRKLSHLKILVVSSMPQEELRQALAEGAHGVLQKPFKKEALLEKVKQLAGIDDE